MPRKPNTTRLAAPGIIDAGQAYALLQAIKALVTLHNDYARSAALHGFGGDSPYLVISYSERES